MTDESQQLSEADRIAAEVVRKLVEAVTGKATHCMRCDQPITHLEQQGRCVHAMPCGCRQYQGKLPKGKKD